MATGGAGLQIDETDPAEYFEVLAKLGEGSYGSVYKALDRRDGKLVAIKVLEVESDTTELQKEINILRDCDCEWIVQYKGSYKKDGNVWIVMEFCGAGSLCDLMAICERTLTEEQIAIVMKMALLGLEYLHAKKKIHRDIKSGNILINHDGDCKLADFGVSAELATTIAKHKTMCLASDTHVALADGTTLRADAVKCGMQLVGQDGAVVDVEAVASGTTDMMYEIAHANKFAYTVTPDHLVTLRWAEEPHFEHTTGTAQIDLVWWTIADGTPARRNLGARPDNDNARATMWAEFYAKAALAGSRASKALRAGDLIDIHAHLLATPTVWRELIEEGRATGRTTVPLHSNATPLESSPPAAASIVFDVDAPLSGADPIALSGETSSMQNLSHVLHSQHLDLTTVAVHTRTASELPCGLADLLARHTAALTFVACGDEAKQSWLGAASVPGVTHLRSQCTAEGVQYLMFQYASRALTVYFAPNPCLTTRLAEVERVVARAHDVILTDAKSSISQSQGVALASIRRIDAPSQGFVGLRVSGNQRFVLADGTLTHNCGTPYWMAPEVLQSSEYNGKADIWSLAVTAIELAVGEPPHSNVHPMRAIFMIPNSDPPTLPDPSKWSADFNDFLKVCLVKNPEKRPTATQLLKGHPFILKAKSKAILAQLVDECMQEIDDYREQEAAEAAANPNGTAGTDAANGTMVHHSPSGVSTNNSTMQSTGTMVQNPRVTAPSTTNYDQGTMVFNQNGGTMQQQDFDDAAGAGDYGTMVLHKSTLTKGATNAATENARGAKYDEPSYMRHMREARNAKSTASASQTGTMLMTGRGQPNVAASASSSAAAASNVTPADFRDLYRTARRFDAQQIGSLSKEEIRETLAFLDAAHANEKAQMEATYEETKKLLKQSLDKKEKGK